MNAPISSQEIRFLMTDTEAARSGAGVYAAARREAQPPVLLRVAQGLLTWLKELPNRRAAEAELSSLTDRELADIGLTRPEIHDVVSRH